MPIIKANIESFVNGDTTVQELVEQVQSTVQAGQGMSDPPSAKITRDANGKVVNVDINLPVDIAKTDLSNAAAKVAEHGGVATSGPFPLEFDSNLDSLVENAVITSITEDDLSLSLSSVDGNNSRFEGASAAQSNGGTGSALRLTDQNTAGVSIGPLGYNHVMRSKILASAASNSLSSIETYSWQMKVKTIAGTSGDNSHNSGIQFDFQPYLNMQLKEFGGNWRLTSDAITHVDTTIPATSFIEIKASIDSTGLLTLTELTSGSNITVTKQLGFAPSVNEVRMFAFEADLQSDVTAITQRPLIIDDLKLTINSGTV